MLISVIIPVYNDAAWLERAVASVLVQDVSDMEIILVDNNSTDGSLALCHELRIRHPDRIVVGTAARQGSAAARNEGLRLARGEWVNFLDADDIFLPGKLSRQLALARADTDWVIQAYYDQAMDGKRTLSGLNDDPWKGLVHNGGLGCTNSHLFRRSLLLKIGGQDESLHNGEDTEMYFRLLKEAPIIVADPHPGSVYVDRVGPRLSRLYVALMLQNGARLKATVNDWLIENRTAYFYHNRGFFEGALLNSIRQVATNDVGKASSLFAEYFPSGIDKETLRESTVTSLAKSYSLLGFSRVEHFRVLVTQRIMAPVRKGLKLHS